jgi:hypothetical protein
MKRIFLILVIIFVVILFMGKGYYTANAKGFVNFKRCRNLKSPVSRTTLIEAFGKPIQIYDEGTNLRLVFETPSIMSGMITASVDKKSDTAFCIKCCEDSGCR